MRAVGNGGGSFAARAMRTSGSNTSVTFACQGTLALGTATSAGNNVFAAQVMPLHLVASIVTVAARTAHTSFNGTTPAAKKYVGPATTTWWKLENVSSTVTAY